MEKTGKMFEASEESQPACIPARCALGFTVLNQDFKECVKGEEASYLLRGLYEG